MEITYKVLFNIPFTCFWVAKYENLWLFDIVRKELSVAPDHYGNMYYWRKI